jgi:hypothetical protein
MKAASATVAAMSQGLTRGFHCAIAAASGFTTVVDCAARAGTGGSVCNSGKNFLLAVCGVLQLRGTKGFTGSFAASKCRRPATQL